jgi:hypothetical protein
MKKKLLSVFCFAILMLVFVVGNAFGRERDMLSQPNTTRQEAPDRPAASGAITYTSLVDTVSLSNTVSLPIVLVNYESWVHL